LFFVKKEYICALIIFSPKIQTLWISTTSLLQPTPMLPKVRFANVIIDGIVASILYSILGKILVPDASNYEDPDAMMAALPMSMAVNLLVYFAYYVGMEASTGKTVGKYVTGTQVVTEDGEQPSGGTIFIRTLCRIIPFEPFSFFGSTPRGWHDNLSKTRVVKTRKDDNDGGGVIR
jgi:uncharacterized RDD family membrane protein YckC